MEMEATVIEGFVMLCGSSCKESGHDGLVVVSRGSWEPDLEYVEGTIDKAKVVAQFFKPREVYVVENSVGFKEGRVEAAAKLIV